MTLLACTLKSPWKQHSILKPDLLDRNWDKNHFNFDININLRLYLQC